MFYLLHSAFIWAVFYAVYAAFLRKETFHAANRFYLLGALVLGLIIPLAPPVAAPAEATQGLSAWMTPIAAARGNAEQWAARPAALTWSFERLIWILYGIGVGVNGYRFVLGLWSIRRLSKRNPGYTSDEGYRVVEMAGLQMPFSFFNTLFWGHPMEITASERASILAHERAHMRQLHSADTLFLEILRVFFWWNPFIYLYRQSLRALHEYLADEAALRSSNLKQYGRLLIGHAASGPAFALANHFIYSQLKQRIHMMTQAKSNPARRWKYAAALPVALLLFLFSHSIEAIGQSKSGFYFPEKKGLPDQVTTSKNDTLVTFDINTYEEKVIIYDSEVHTQVDRLPRFVGKNSHCEDLAIGERDTCAQRTFSETLREALEIPNEVVTGRVKGRVVVQLTILYMQTGAYAVVGSTRLTQSLSPNCDMAVLKALAMLQGSWIPAVKNGKNTSCVLYVPVDF